MTEKKQIQIEDHALAPVRAADRKGWLSLAFVQTGMIICVPSLLLGCMLAMEMSLGKAIAAGATGYLITIVLSFFLGIQGADLGIPSAKIVTSTFGTTGTRIVISSLLTISMVGWFGINSNVCGESFTHLMATATGIEIPVVVSSILWGIVMLASAVFGMNALKKLDSISLPLLIIIMLAGTVLALKNFGTGGLFVPVSGNMSFIQGVGLSFSFTAVAAVTCSDITRFQKNRRETVKSTFWGMFPAALFTLCLGIVMTKVTGDYDITSVLATVGMPILGVVVLILATWTTNSLNAYSAGLDAVMTFNLPDNKRREATVVAGVIGIVLAAFGILDHIEMFLSLLSYVFSAVGGIMIADYWIVGRGKAANWHEVPGINWTGMIALVLAILLAAFIGVDYSGIVWGMLFYVIAERFVPSASREKKAASVSE